MTAAAFGLQEALSALDGYGKITARLLRETVRSQYMPAALARLNAIGQGEEVFPAITRSGTVTIEYASPETQVRALLGLVAVGLPAQIGLADDDGNVLPGVIALGDLELETARVAAHRFLEPALDPALAVGEVAAPGPLSGEDPDQGSLFATMGAERSGDPPPEIRRNVPPVDPGVYVPPEGLAVVVVEEGADGAIVQTAVTATEAPEPEITTEQRILLRRRASKRRGRKGDGTD